MKKSNSSPGSQHERCAASLVLVLNVGLVLEQQMNDISVTLPAGQRQGDVVLTPRRDIDLCTMEEEELGH